uniref:hypothetical protein n=1 Tax=Ponticaulis koreensis TaxID=1123045 RepID=UPI0003B6FEA7|nr:hypothetical protein [Ponticaulis koreensis]
METFSIDEFEKISTGVIPVQMEDKWFIFMEGTRLFFHRSWTGQAVYCVTFIRHGDSVSVESAMISDAIKQPVDLNYHSKLLHWLIGVLLLDQPLKFPVPSKISTKQVSAYQHHIAGTGFEADKPEEVSSGTGGLKQSGPKKLKRWWKFWN